MQIKIKQLLIDQPSYRLKQIYKARFNLNINSYEQITTLPKNLRKQLKDTPWITVKEKLILKSKVDNTHKALLELIDDNVIETVLMERENKKINSQQNNRHTICLSTQIGCAMNCSFCATGQMGFTRNLTIQEIVDQYRFWQKFLNKHNYNSHISNIVLMGQGEPLLNYDNVKEAVNIILSNTDIGSSKITLSTVGIKSAMQKMLLDANFPPIRFALSLHSAIEATRSNIIPSHQPGFLSFLVNWAQKYYQKYPSRSHFIGLEYTLLNKINNSNKDLKALIELASQLKKVRINLIDYNQSSANLSLKTVEQSIPKKWQTELNKAGFICTIRHSHGQDIDAACGQLQNNFN